MTAPLALASRLLPPLLLLAPPFALLLAMHVAARALARQAQQLFGHRLQLILFAWLGTIVHEGSHAVACVLFGHRVHRIRWFDPQATNGSLGSVEHSYRRGSLYQQVGNVVIGLAPLLAGALVIVVAAQQLVGLSPPVAHAAGLASSLSSLSSPSWPTVSGWMTTGRDIARDISPWRGAAFVFICLSVGGSMHLSASDVRGTLRGALVLAVGVVVALLAIPLLATWPWLSAAALVVSAWGALCLDALVLALIITTIGALSLWAIRVALAPRR